jgi:DNA-3-methyladenine glycosylase
MGLSPEFFTQGPVESAQALIGHAFRYRGVGGVIVETEAYLEEGDEACHTFFRPKARAFVRDADPGTGYVYLNYGMHWLVNVLCKGAQGNGFVLLRALEPRWGLSSMRRRRGREALTELCSGPGKLSVALGMDGRHHATPIASLFHQEEEPMPWVARPRIGISRAQDKPWRFLVPDNVHVSRG